MIVYSSIYLMLAILGLGHFSGRLREVFFCLLFVFFVLFVGTRFETGCDFTGYLRRFQYLGAMNGPLLDITEPGYYLLSYLTKEAGLGFVWLNVFAASIFFYYLIKFCRNHPRPFLLVALLFPILVIQLSMSGVRQALAVAFLMGALNAFIKSKRFQVVVYILIGSSFHQSLIILLPLALMVGRSYSFVRVLGALIVLLPVAIYLLAGRMEVYEDRYISEIYGEMNSRGAILRLGLLVMTAVLFEIFTRRMSYYYPREYNLMRVFSLVSLALVPVMLVNTVALHRLIFYVVPMHAYILAALPRALFSSKRVTQAAELCVVGLYAAYIFVWFLVSRHADICYVPYESYLL